MKQLQVRRYLLDRLDEIPVVASPEWKPIHAAPRSVTQIDLWAIEDPGATKRVSTSCLVGGISAFCDLPMDGGWNGHITTWEEPPYVWHLFRSTRGLKAVK